ASDNLELLEPVTYSKSTRVFLKLPSRYIRRGCFRLYETQTRADKIRARITSNVDRVTLVASQEPNTLIVEVCYEAYVTFPRRTATLLYTDRVEFRLVKMFKLIFMF